MSFLIVRAAVDFETSIRRATSATESHRGGSGSPSLELALAFWRADDCRRCARWRGRRWSWEHFPAGTTRQPSWRPS
jgi:hypothetical protein